MRTPHGRVLIRRCLDHFRIHMLDFGFLRVRERVAEIPVGFLLRLGVNLHGSENGVGHQFHSGSAMSSRSTSSGLRTVQFGIVVSANRITSSIYFEISSWLISSLLVLR